MPSSTQFVIFYFFFCWNVGVFLFFKIFSSLIQKDKNPPTQFFFIYHSIFYFNVKNNGQILFPPRFLYVAKKSPPQITLIKTSTISIWFPYKKWKKKELVTSPFYRYLWSTVMLTGPEVGDHFTLNLHYKVIPD